MASPTCGHEFEQAPGVGDGQGCLVCCIPWGRRVRHARGPWLDTEDLPWAPTLEDESVTLSPTESESRAGQVRLSPFPRWTFVGKVMSLLFNMLFRLVITFLPRSNFMAVVTICSDFGAPQKIFVTVSIVSPSIHHEVVGPDAIILVF